MSKVLPLPEDMFNCSKQLSASWSKGCVERGFLLSQTWGSDR